MKFQQLLTWAPFIFFPLSYLLQIIKVIEKKSEKGQDVWSYFLFFLANLGAFLFIEKFGDVRAIGGFLLTALLQIISVIVILQYSKKSQNIKNIIYGTTATATLLTLYLFFFKRKFLHSISSLAGFIPAFVFPYGTWLAYKEVKDLKNREGVSLLGWIFQFLGNIGGYFLTGKLKDLKSISGFILPALLDIFIILTLIKSGGGKGGKLPVE